MTLLGLIARKKSKKTPPAQVSIQIVVILLLIFVKDTGELVEKTSMPSGIQTQTMSCKLDMKILVVGA